LDWKWHLYYKWLTWSKSIARIIHMESLVGLITKEQRSPFMCGNYICRILFTFVLYGVWFQLSRQKGVLIRRAVLNTPINGFVSFPHINLICNYSAIVVLCIFNIFCEQENVFFSFNFPCHDMSQKLALAITLCMWQTYALKILIVYL
jgi:hypothetical protein